MNAPGCDDLDYIHFLVAAQRAFSCCEAARCRPRATIRQFMMPSPACGNASLLTPRRYGREWPRSVQPAQGVLILDDTTLGKPYARQMGLVTRHWSGLHWQVAQGINLLTLLWSDG